MIGAQHDSLLSWFWVTPVKAPARVLLGCDHVKRPSGDSLRLSEPWGGNSGKSWKDTVWDLG